MGIGHRWTTCISSSIDSEGSCVPICTRSWLPDLHYHNYDCLWNLWWWNWCPYRHTCTHLLTHGMHMHEHEKFMWGFLDLVGHSNNVMTMDCTINSLESGFTTCSELNHYYHRPPSYYYYSIVYIKNVNQCISWTSVYCILYCHSEWGGGCTWEVLNKNYNMIMTI